MSPDPLLSVRGLDVAYGPVQVLFGVDLEVGDGEIVALLGTNGAGKSTLLKAISGLVPPRRGSITFDGVDIATQPAHRLPERGIVQMPGGRGVFPTLTVAENLRLAGWLLEDRGDDIDEATERIVDLFPRLPERWSELAGDLSGGEQQMLALGQSLLTRPRLLMIDELSLGLAPTVVSQLIDVVRGVHESGTTVIVVEQSVNVALELAERAVFMEKGEVRFSGEATELTERPDILRSVFIAGATATDGDGVRSGPGGRRAKRGDRSAKGEPPTRTPPPPDAPVMARGRQIHKRFGGIAAVDHVDLEVRRGEILGLIGQNGAGKTTLFDCMSGFLPLDGGSVEVRGLDVTRWPAHERAWAGLGRSFQEARLYPTLSVAETVAVSLEQHLANRDIFAAAFSLPASYESERAARARVDELIGLMGLGAFRQKLVAELSTGTRRIVELACILAQDPSVVLLDEPSGGVAQKETEALGPLLQRVQIHTGCSLLIIEHDMPLLSAICDRMVALELGAVIAEGTPPEVLADPRVIESYLGTDRAAIQRSGSRS